MAAPFFSTPFQPYVYQSPQQDVTPFQILGGEAQIVQIMLKPQEKVIAKPGEFIWLGAFTVNRKLSDSPAGSMCYMSGSIQMENVFVAENEAGVWQWLFGKNVASIVLLNAGLSDGFVGIAAPSLARILPIDLAMLGGELLCQPDAFLCSINNVKVTNTVVQRAPNAVVGAELLMGMLMSLIGILETEAIWPGACIHCCWWICKVHSTSKPPDCALDGSDLISATNDQESFIAKMRFEPLGARLCTASRTSEQLDRAFDGSDLISATNDQGPFIAKMRSELSDARSNGSEKNLEVGEVIAVDVACVVALSATVNVQVKYNGPMRRVVFGGENLATTVLTGPGIVFIQSLPFHRFSRRIARAVTSTNMRENPKFYFQIFIFFFLAYVVILSSLILTENM
ncbi:hypothetical protein RHMOL_Rhmol07G0132300 [Rhododendron molle]|uniref:Uncharacterized protein n=1 Tax=Rhododendron molle TaxID=49168 RepID=A0ACC0N247_RHOML|nr:hypothetical protein RHMOL_Rhmol07G0132300 [Rhododendron molle]